MFVIRKVKKYQTYDNDESTGFLKNHQTKAVKSAIFDVDSDSSLLSQIKLSRTENNDHNSLEKSFKNLLKLWQKIILGIDRGYTRSYE